MTRFAIVRPSDRSPDGQCYFTGRFDVSETAAGPVASAETSFFPSDARTFTRWSDASRVAGWIEHWSPNARADRRWQVVALDAEQVGAPA